MRRYFFVLLAFAVAALPATAQVQYGTVSGVAVDPGQAPLPGVTVTLSGPAMQGSRSTVTDAAGRFRSSPCPAGSGYPLTLELAGFASLERTDLVVNIGSDTAVTAQMSVTRVAETVSVTSEQIVVDTTKATVDTTVEWKLADTLPNHRFFTRSWRSPPACAGEQPDDQRGLRRRQPLPDRRRRHHRSDLPDLGQRDQLGHRSRRPRSRPRRSRPSTAAPPAASSTWSPSREATTSRCWRGSCSRRRLGRGYRESTGDGTSRNPGVA